MARRTVDRQNEEESVNAGAIPASANGETDDAQEQIAQPITLEQYVRDAIKKVKASNEWSVLSEEDQDSLVAEASLKASSEWHLKHGAPNIMAGFGPEALPANYSDEELNRKQKAFEENGPRVHVITDEWDNTLSTGDSPFDEAGLPYVEANPDKHFRFIGETHRGRVGMQGYQPVKTPDGKTVRVGDQELAWIPKKEQENRVRRTRAEVEDTIQKAGADYDEKLARAEVDSGGLVRKVKSEGEVVERGRKRAA